MGTLTAPLFHTLDREIPRPHGCAHGPEYVVQRPGTAGCHARDDALSTFSCDRISMPCSWEIALSDERDDGIDPALDYRETLASTIPMVAPRAASLFVPVRDRYGWRLALVFGNHAPQTGLVLTIRAHVSIATLVPARGRRSITPPTGGDSIGSATTIAPNLIR